MGMEIQVKKLTALALLPERAHHNDAGADLFSLEAVEILPRSAVKVRTGIAVTLAPGTAGLIWGKSSLESGGLIVTAGLVDEGYRGEIIVCMFNLTEETKKLVKGQKIAQLVVTQVQYPAFTEASDLEKSARDCGGFGSTGRHSNENKV
jgi:dUTP pyrophosphatase